MQHLTAMFYSNPVEPYVLVNAFFIYSFMGWVMECIVIRREKGFWENRGFARVPFCIIYGFGAMLGYLLLKPFSHNYFLLYLVGAVCATAFEYLTARLMLRLFGTFWWDYTNKPFNYKGILCLESTLGWGVIAVFLFAFMHKFVVGVSLAMPRTVGLMMAVVLSIVYAVDFMMCMRRSLLDNDEDTECYAGKGNFAK
ncbi:MAG TPA: putative ABC transporter permease [Candidatus Ruthenibacterium merdavium]|uniref:ABC transporter permease n=1 Tax=Candidatus Ruthenibacterium merdavium TaxID=2838752 RepID=A0A9D2Q4F1_9FIRM|nr:putative ABC transporter permease [Candidatus Ruthenibacterium merdavium]